MVLILPQFNFFVRYPSDWGGVRHRPNPPSQSFLASLVLPLFRLYLCYLLFLYRVAGPCPNFSINLCCTKRATDFFTVAKDTPTLFLISETDNSTPSENKS